jgi:(1->4)-alpha-D-glucan 1-alpha-D-glucosylmutase
VDFAARSAWLAGGDHDAVDAEKVHLVATALRVRREHADAFVGAYAALEATGSVRAHVVAFRRGSDVITVATRLAAGLDAAGGWTDTSLLLPPGEWRDELSGVRHSGDVPLLELLANRPVALLTRSA